MALTQRAVEKLSLAEIIKQGLLDQPLLPNVIKQLKTKITLENLHQADLLTEDLDSKFIVIALENNNNTNIIWSYMAQRRDSFLTNQPEISPFSEEGEVLGIQLLRISRETFLALREQAVKDFLVILISILENEGVVLEVDNFRFIWESHYLLFVWLETNKQVHLDEIIYNNLDDFVEGLHLIAKQVSNVRTLLFTLPLTLTDLEDYERVILTLIRDYVEQTDKGFINELWESLKEESVETQPNFDFSISPFTNENVIVRVIVDRLFLFTNNTINIFEKEDGNLVLASFNLNLDKIGSRE